MDNQSVSTEMFHYTASGLDYIWLKNGVDIEETSYGEAYSIHDVEGLHKTIGYELVMNKPLLTRSEVRFLRKEMDLPQKDLADLIGVGESSVRNWESSDRCNIPPPADRLLRKLYLEHVDGDGTITDLINRISQLNREMYECRMELEEFDGVWKTAA